MDGTTIRDGGGWRSPYLAEFMPLAVNVDDERFYANIRAACQRDLPWLQAEPDHGGHAVIVGGGPSLAETLPEIRWRFELGQTIVALNNTARYLIERGIYPHYHVLLDARPGNARFIRPGMRVHLIASQCAPEVFDKAHGQVILWHPHVAGIHDIIGDRETALIGGGTTVGLQSMAIMRAKGFKKFHLYGFDSSYRGGTGHAYPQPENDNDEVIRVEVNGHSFLCARWMAHQADEFKNVALQLAEQDCLITVAGDGLLPYIARLMTNPPDEDAATYDLARAPASWDFTTWLINAEMDKRRRGISKPLRVSIIPGPRGGFRDDNLPVDTAGRQQLLDNVIRQSLALIGAVEDPTANGYQHGYLARSISDAARKGEQVPRFKAPTRSLGQVAFWLIEHGIRQNEYITITLREAEHWPHRNSNVEAWLAFAATCGAPVVFVRDTAKADDPFPALTCPAASKDLHTRAALYELARCNFFVGNGPAMLGMYGTAPYLMLKPICPDFSAGTPEWWAENIGIPEGTQPPWATPKQRIVWADDTLKNIRKAWAKIKETI